MAFVIMSSKKKYTKKHQLGFWLFPEPKSLTCQHSTALRSLSKEKYKIRVRVRVMQCWPIFTTLQVTSWFLPVNCDRIGQQVAIQVHLGGWFTAT